MIDGQEVLAHTSNLTTTAKICKWEFSALQVPSESSEWSTISSIPPFLPSFLFLSILSISYASKIDPQVVHRMEAVDPRFKFPTNTNTIRMDWSEYVYSPKGAYCR